MLGLRAVKGGWERGAGRGGEGREWVVYIDIYMYVYVVVAVVGQSGRSSPTVSVGAVPWWCGVGFWGSLYGYRHGPFRSTTTSGPSRAGLSHHLTHQQGPYILVFVFIFICIIFMGPLPLYLFMFVFIWVDGTRAVCGCG